MLSGHLFQNRYRSFACEEEGYLLALVRYIGPNPLRARWVSDLEALDRYPRSSHAVLMGHRLLEGQVVEELLARFAARRKDAVREYRVWEYRAFVEAGVALGPQAELAGGGLHRSPWVAQGVTGPGGGREQRQVYDDRFSAVASSWKLCGGQALWRRTRSQRCRWRR